MAVNINIPTQVSQTITNGVTAFAPSEDAVFDALALKQDAITNPVTGTGANGQVSFWTGTGAQSGDNGLFWDNTNKMLGVGTNLPTKTLVLSKAFGADDGILMTDTGGGYFQITNSSALNFQPIFQGQARGNASSLIFKGLQTTTASPTATVTRFISRASNDSSPVANGVFSFAFENGTSTILALTSNNNVIIQNGGTFTDAGFRLDVNGTARVRGALTVRGIGTTGTTINTDLGNLTGSIFRIRDDGIILIGSSTFSPYIGASAFNMPFFSQITTQGATGGAFSFRSTGNMVFTSGVHHFIFNSFGFAPTSGNADISGITLNNTINQTGGANGITRGLFVNPILTSAANWRSIETSNNIGYAAFFGGSAPLFFNNGANLEFGTATGTRIGTATNQRLSLWNATPDVQPTTAITAAAFVANTSGIVDDTATFGGYTMGQVVAALQRIGALA